MTDGLWLMACRFGHLAFRFHRLRAHRNHAHRFNPSGPDSMSPILRRRDPSGELGDFLPSEDRLACDT